MRDKGKGIDVSETAVDKSMNAMAEHICDHLCRFPHGSTNQDELDELDDICAGCVLGQYMCDISNAYNRLDDFEQSQCAKLLVELGAEQEKYRWIPVSERLPEQGISVLTVDRDGGMDVDFLESPDKWFWDQEDGYKPIAWMPLPAAYQPEEAK